MAVEQQPLIRIRLGSCAEKAMPDETLHAHVGDIRAAPWLHGSQKWRNEGFDDGGSGERKRGTLTTAAAEQGR
jgi:hypothetical protein